jgi:hypothetical protein
MRARWATGVGIAALALAFPAAAAEAPTIAAHPEVVGVGVPFVLQGTVPSRRAGDDVRIEGRQCRDTFFRAFGGAQTGPGGSWSYQPLGGFLAANTAFRAHANGAVSRTIVVRRRANVQLHVKGRGRFDSFVVANYANLHGKPVRLERYTGSAWVLVRTARLVRTGGGWHRARFVVRTRGLQLRAAVSERVVSPCYAAGVSPIARS